MPIAALGEESERERRSMTALPPTYYLHVWWSRKPLVMSRASILASLLPADANRDQFLHVLGIHGDPLEARRRIAKATREGVRLGAAAYGYPRAFKYSPEDADIKWLFRYIDPEYRVVDPFAGGGSIPFESARFGISTWANDLNPVAAYILDATARWPILFGKKLLLEFTNLSQTFLSTVKNRLKGAFPDEPIKEAQSDGFLYSRTISCPYCDGLVPLGVHWRLAPGGIGIKLRPNLRDGPNSPKRTCSFEIVHNSEDQSDATVVRGVATCPYNDCGRVIDGDEIKRQAQVGEMGEQLYAVVYKYPIKTETKTGKTRTRMVRAYRTPRLDDDNAAEIATQLAQKLPIWEALDMVPTEKYPSDTNDNRPIQYGMPLWRDLFSPRQLLCHGTSVEVFRELLNEDEKTGELTDLRKAAYGYLAISVDKLLNFNCRLSRWDANRNSIVGKFDRHDYAMKWSYGEMAPLVAGAGFDWAIKQTSKCIKELTELLRPESAITEVIRNPERHTPVHVTCKPGDRLDHLTDQSVDLIVTDPPYYDNVMYAELSDFFYVWLKRTAGYVFPDLFRRALTDKDNEAVANPIRFKGQKGVTSLAERDYQQRMASIFAECRRVLKANGLMTLMFNHKATGAWDALTTGLIQAGFKITASWPVNTEAPGSIHIKDKAAAKSTVLLVCRPRDSLENETDADAQYWEDIEPQVELAVNERITEFQEAGIEGVDLWLAAFGPALEKFSESWPLTRGTPRPRPDSKQLKLIDALGVDAWDPYAVTPDDALNAARREVNRWRMTQIAPRAATDLDPITNFFVSAWYTFKAPTFPYDEALQLARSIGVDLDGDIVSRLAIKKSGDLTLLDSISRASRSFLGPSNGARGMVDAIHHAAVQARTGSLASARDQLAANNDLHRNPEFQTALETILEVLPPSKRFTRVELSGDNKDASSDFEVLYDLSQLLYRDDMKHPKQLDLWQNLIDED